MFGVFVCSLFTQTLKQSTGFLYLKLSLPMMWPLTKQRDDPIDCDSFTYDRPHFGSSLAVKDRSLALSAARSFLLASSVSSARLAVDCRLPDRIAYLNYSVLYRDTKAAAGGGVWGWTGGGGGVTEIDCSASMTTSGQSQTVLELTLVGAACSSLYRQLHTVTTAESSADAVTLSFSCLDSSSVTVDGGDSLIIVDTLSASGTLSRTEVETQTVSAAVSQPAVLYCWLFPKSPPALNMFYLLNGTQCHQVTQPNARLDQLHQYMAQFSTSRSHARTLQTIPRNTAPDRFSTLPVRSPTLMTSSTTTTSRSTTTARSAMASVVSTTPPPSPIRRVWSTPGSLNAEASRQSSRSSLPAENVISSGTTVPPVVMLRTRSSTKLNTDEARYPPLSSPDLVEVRREEEATASDETQSWFSHFLGVSAVVPVVVIVVFFLCRCVS